MNVVYWLEVIGAGVVGSLIVLVPYYTLAFWATRPRRR